MAKATPLTKLSSADLQKLAATDQYDTEQAFEFGFAKCAKDMELTEDEFRTFYAAGCQKVSE